ncbi:hypothetical protein CNR22_23535 [Sphingobacteriaceae bacterium]|nr:hypothetical protein CNR22_23535 [Sphingobacteriaceae bacterium]
MEKSYSMCQSCSMPLKDDLQHGGTNADGTKSNKYCSYCYQNGKFTQPDITAAEMQVVVKGKLKEMGGVYRLFAGLFSKGVPKLERWQKLK